VSNQVERIYSSARNSKETGEIIRISPTWLEIQYSMRFDLQAQIYINCGFAEINYLVLNIAVHFYKELNELKSLVLCSTADFYSENKTKRGKYIVNI
jgi:hypothetical protein